MTDAEIRKVLEDAGHWDTEEWWQGNMPHLRALIEAAQAEVKGREIVVDVEHNDGWCFCSTNSDSCRLDDRTCEIAWKPAPSTCPLRTGPVTVRAKKKGE